MRGLFTLAGIAVVAYWSGHDKGQTRGFAEGVGKMAGAFTAGVERGSK